MTDEELLDLMHQRPCQDCGYPPDSFACKIRHIQINSGSAKAARD